MCRNDSVWFGPVSFDGTCKVCSRLLEICAYLLKVMRGARGDSSSVLHDFFVRAYFRTVYFIITYLLSLFSSLIGSSVIITDIQKGIITNLFGYFFVCLGSSIISTYS